MWLQPWFFSMGLAHLAFGHIFAFAIIQFKFSLSLEFFNSHFLNIWQSAGLCYSWPHLKQNEFPHKQCTIFVKLVSLTLSAAYSHSFEYGHHLTFLLSSVNDLQCHLMYNLRIFGVVLNTYYTIECRTTKLQLAYIQHILRLYWDPSLTFSTR